MPAVVVQPAGGSAAADTPANTITNAATPITRTASRFIARLPSSACLDANDRTAAEFHNPPRKRASTLDPSRASDDGAARVKKQISSSGTKLTTATVAAAAYQGRGA